MKKMLALLLVCCLILGLAASAFAAGGPKISKQPESATTDEKGTVVFKISASNYTGLTWRFVNPETGEEVTAKNLSKTIKGVKVTGPNKQTITLKKVPAEMHGWTVYCHLSGNGYQVDSDKVLLLVNGLPAPSEETVSEPEPEAEPEAEPEPDAEKKSDKKSKKKTEEKAEEKADDKAEEPSETVEEPAAEPEEERVALYVDDNNNPVYELPEIATVTVTADNVTLYPLDHYGNPKEDKACTELTFEGSGSLVVRADWPVQYWTVNGIQIEPPESVTTLTLRNVTANLAISAVQQSESASKVDADNMVQVYCEGCTFTYMKGGLKSVASGSVPSGATITVMASGAAAEGGYSINDGGYEHEGKASFRLTVTENTTIRTK